MRLLFFMIPILFIFSCNTGNQQQEPFASLLKNCDQVNIVFYNSQDSLTYHTTDSTGIRILVNLVTGKKETVVDTCQPIGRLHYMVERQPVYEAEFALAAAGKGGCNYISYTMQQHTYKHRLSERASNLLRQVLAVNRNSQ